MNKQNMELIIETAKKITGKGHLEDTLEAAVLLLVTPVTDIAHQLTRIADHLDTSGLCYECNKWRNRQLTPDAEKFIENLTKLLSEDGGEEEYLKRGMAIVNDWRKKQSQSPAPDTLTDALVEAVKDILKRDLPGYTAITNCVLHSPLKILDRPKDCELCQTDISNKLSHTFSVNEFLNHQTDDIESTLAAYEKAVR